MSASARPFIRLLLTAFSTLALGAVTAAGQTAIPASLQTGVPGAGSAALGWEKAPAQQAGVVAAAEKDGTPTPRTVSVPEGSLGDVARNLREKQRAKVKITPKEAEQLFKAVDEITAFAAKDSGLPQQSRVKRQLLGQGEVERMVREQAMSEEEKQERQRGLIAMKKFGFMPRDFDVEGFAAKAMGESIAGFYDAKTKMISLLNWMPLEEQKGVLAHELTHALQDQNYDLQKWHKGRKTRLSDGSKSVVNSDTDEGESGSAGRGVTEGQAMVVMFDYMLAASGHDLEHSPGLFEPLQEQMSYGSEGPEMHRAPLAIRESMAFPYREGTLFEVTLLQKGGRDLAFKTTLENPPHLTHEIIQPRAYMQHEKIAPVRIPNLQPVLGEKARMQDSGVIGELDTRIFIHQFESKWLSKELSPLWRGASYVTIARSPEGQPQSTRDVALLYVSRWETELGAERFAKFYAGAVAKRYQQAKPVPDFNPAPAKHGAPLAAFEVETEEGPVVVEQWPGNLVIVTESFDIPTAARLRDAVLGTANGPRSSAKEQRVGDNDLTLRLAALPEFSALRAAVRDSYVRAVMIAAGGR